MTFKPGGEEHYGTYDAMGEAKLKELGGEIIFRGHRATVAVLDQSKAGRGDELAAGAELNATKWDRVTMRKYPTKDAVLELGASDEYRAARCNTESRVCEKSFVYAFSGELPLFDDRPKRQHPMALLWLRLRRATRFICSIC